MNGSGIEALAIKRASYAEGDKVRYRVYRAPDDFVVVIAENALMASKLSGIAHPSRIMRDLPSEGIVQSGKLAVAETEVGITFSTAPKEHKPMAAEIAAPAPSDFVPMAIRDLQQAKSRRLRIISAEELSKMMGITAGTRPAATPAPAAPAPAPAAEPRASEPPPVRPATEAPSVIDERPVEEEGPLTPEQVQALLGEQ